uniref:LRRcap domain-containing protein n=1 Tax=Macrostomum lignano TaxID=282301 RepID=A0A1I8FZQ2_9PLAT
MMSMQQRLELERRNKEPANITELNLDNCKASALEGLTDEYVNLETLSLINVGLQSLAGFPALPKLHRLELSDNRLLDGLQHLAGCPALAQLNLSGNRIRDLDALKPLASLKKLRTLDLYGCAPVMSMTRLRRVDAAPSGSTKARMVATTEARAAAAFPGL